MPSLSAPPSPRHPWKAWTAAVVIGFSLTCVLTYPMARYFGTVGRFDTGDGRFSVWNVAWVAHALLESPRHLFDANIFYPHPSTLTYSELNLVAGAFGVPAYALTRNAVAAHNSAVFLGLLIAFMATWALVRRLTGSFGAGLVAATGYAFSAYTSSHTAEIQLLMFFGFPLIMLAFHRLVERATMASGVVLGGALGLAALASGYYGVFAVGMLACATFIWAKRAWRYWAAMGIAALTTAVLVVPVWWPYQHDRAAAGAVRTTTIDELTFYSAAWRDYFTSGTIIDGHVLSHLVTARSGEVLFPGFVVSIFAIAGLIAAIRSNADRRTVAGYAAIGIAAFWASFGPAGKLYLLLMKVLPGISFLRAPGRLGVVVIFALSVLAGFGVRWLSRSGIRTSACLLVLVVELWVPWPLQGWPLESRAYQMLASLPRGGVVEFPFPYQRENFHRHTQAMVRSMVNWQPLINGYSDFIPDDFSAMALPINGFPDAASFEILRAHDVRYVLVRVGDYGAYRQRLLDRFPPYDRFLRRLTDDHDVWLLEIVGWPERSGTMPLASVTPSLQ